MRSTFKRNVFAAAALLMLPSCSPGVDTLSDALSIGARAGTYEPVRLPYALVAILDDDPFPARPQPALAVAAPYDGAEAGSEQAASCLAQAVYYEARSETIEGQRAVAQVVLNRVRHPAFPGTICGVVFEGASRRTGCQFSFTCDGSMRGLRDHHAWQTAREVAAAALQGQVVPQVGLATHYHTRQVDPYWAASLRQIASVGEHVFYGWRGSAGTASAFRNRIIPESPPQVRLASARAPAAPPKVASRSQGRDRRGEPAPAMPGFEMVLEPDQVLAEASASAETTPATL